jgi:flagellar export protein FliJ
MARDVLRTLLTLRRIGVDAARQDLIKSEQYQSAVASHMTACDRAIVESEPTHPDYGHRHASFAALNGYVDKMQKRSNLLKQHMPVAQMKTDTARNTLAQARLAEKSIQNMAQTRDREKAAELERRSQLSLDEIGRVILRFSPGGRDDC